MKIFITVDFIVNLYFISCLNFGQFWTMAAQCVIKEKKKRPEILVMTTLYTRYEQFIKQQGITIIRKNVHSVWTRNSKSATTTFLTDFIL